ncbi:MAG: hypothetical protein J6K37_02020 [Lachnospiraceae bacterium]|nr:hypothetical protein [Lachnospiraceae bacterium]
MKLKYYMRGLGIGIVVTALLMGFAISKQKEPMTDEEIRQRALEMGMIEQNGVLADDLGADGTETVPEENAEDVSEEISGETVEDVQEVIPSENPDDDIINVSDNEPADVAEEPDIEENVTVEEFVVITVNGGDGSRTVANKLQEAGLIEDAAAYDVYLCQNGYDKRIATGNHEIPVGASLEEIAKEITTRKK